MYRRKRRISTFDEYSKIDKFASTTLLFEEFIKKSDWEEYYKGVYSEVKTRVIVFCSELENLILHESFDK